MYTDGNNEASWRPHILPPELLAHIGSFLTREPRALASCMLVSRSWYEGFRPSFYHRVIFENVGWGDCEKITAQVEADPRIKMWTRNLTICRPFSTPDEFPGPLSFLTTVSSRVESCFRRITTLELEGYCFSHYRLGRDLASMSLSRTIFAAITSLTLDAFWVVSDVLLHLLVACPRLKHLYFTRSCHFYQDDDSFPIHDQLLPRLQSLSLISLSIDSDICLPPYGPFLMSILSETATPLTLETFFYSMCIPVGISAFCNCTPLLRDIHVVSAPTSSIPEDDLPELEFLARDSTGALPPTVVLEEFTDLLNVPQVLPTSNVRKVSFVISSLRNTSSRTRLYASIDTLLCEERFDRLLEVRIHYRGRKPTLAAKRLHFWFGGLSSIGKLRVLTSRSSTTGIPVELDACRSAVRADMADSPLDEWDLDDDIGAFMSCFLFAAPDTANL